jgi:5-methylcytosine-specific restriction protein A
MSDLEARFERDMIETVYRTAGRETGYWASYFLRSVKRHGGVAAAKRLLAAKGLSKGLVALRDKDRLDLAMETLVLKSEYAALFTEGERATAARRLDDVQRRKAPDGSVAPSAAT